MEDGSNEKDSIYTDYPADVFSYRLQERQESD
jgi:hypothetical protein